MPLGMLALWYFYRFIGSDQLQDITHIFLAPIPRSARPAHQFFFSPYIYPTWEPVHRLLLLVFVHVICGQ